MGCPTKNYHFGVFGGTTISGNTHIYIYTYRFYMGNARNPHSAGYYLGFLFFGVGGIVISHLAIFSGGGGAVQMNGVES